MNWFLLSNSLLVTSGATLLAVVFGVLAALVAAGLSPRWQKLFGAAAVIALVLPPFLVTNCWIELLGETGVWRRWLPFNIYSLGGTIWLLALLTWPISFFFAGAAWRRVEPSQLEVDPMLRGSALLRWLLLPMARTALVQGAVLTFVLGFNNFAVPAILQVKVYPAELWVDFNTTFDNMAALRMCWPLLLVPMLLLFCFRGKEVGWSWRTNGVTAALWRRQLGASWWWGSAIISMIAIVFSVCVPAWQLVGSTRTWHEFGTAFAAGQSALGHSLAFSVITASLVAVFALVTWRVKLDFFLWTAFFVPGVLLGIALINIFNRPLLGAIYHGTAIVLIAYFIRYAALGWNTVAGAKRKLDRSLNDVAQLEGASRWQMLRYVHWPQISAPVAAAWYVTYLLCLWDVETIVLIVPPGGENLSLRVFNLLHYGHNSQVNALCLLLLVLALVPLLVWNSFRKFLPALLALTLVGCSPGDSNRAVLASKIFSQSQVIGGRGTGVGEFNKPRSVAVDGKDNLYVVDMTGRVQKFSPEGVYLSGWQMPETAKGKPKGMCHDHAGNIILVEPHYSRVNEFTPEGKLIVQWGVHGTNVGQLGMPRSAAVNSRGEIFVTEYTLSDRVQSFTARGDKCLSAFGQLGEKPGDFNRAEGIAIDAKDRIYVADSCNHRIQIFSPDGKFLRAYGKAGNGVGELSYPYDIQVDEEGRQYVCEFGNSRIQVFDANDHPIEIIGEAGGNPGQLSNPWSIALDSKGNLYIADAINHRVQKFLRKEKTG